MKLRLRENSIRLRLLQSEVSELRANGIVSEKIRFNSLQTLIYTIKSSRAVKMISARFENEEIVVEIPFDALRRWTETNLIGLENEQPVDETAHLKIIIEKDFYCPDRPSDSDNADAFPNPKTKC